jgi:hypothetical protein
MICKRCYAATLHRSASEGIEAFLVFAGGVEFHMEYEEGQHGPFDSFVQYWKARADDLGIELKVMSVNGAPVGGVTNGETPTCSTTTDLVSGTSKPISPKGAESKPHSCAP